MANKITRQELLTQLESGTPTILVEALPPMYYEEAHLPGAINLPHDQVDELATALLPDKAAAIVVYCSNGPCQNSGLASNRLVALGYTDVKDYHEGKQDWIEAGLPTESGATVGVK